MNAMKSRNVTMSTLVVISVILLTLPALALAEATSPQQERDQARQNELHRRGDEERMAYTHSLKDQFVVQVQHANDLITRLVTEEAAFTKQKKALLTSDEGKALAQDPDNFKTFLQLYEHPYVTADEIKGKQIAITSIVNTLKAEGKQLDVGYLPSLDTQREAARLEFWAEDRLAHLQTEQAALKTRLIKAAKVKELAKAPTLARTIEDHQAQEYELLVKLKAYGEHLADNDSQRILVDAARLAKLEQTKAEADRALEQKRTEIAQMKLDQELKILQVKQDAERRQFEAEKAYRDALAEIEKLRKDADARRVIKQTQDDIHRHELLDDAERTKKIALVKSPEVRHLLAPFFATGYTQPDSRLGSYKPQPISLSHLIRFGALNPNPRGLERLLIVATDPRDSERPRWSFGHVLVRLSPQDRNDVVQAQQYLIELGNLMVEQGLLAP